MASRNSSVTAKKADNHGAETLAEVFRCFICMEKLRDAHLCPHCSKLCCYVCIRRWITEQRSQCPHCRASLHLHQLVNCRWVNEVTQQLDTLQTVDVSNSRGDNSTNDRCITHNEKLSVCCQTCRQCICYQCALWGGTHSGHMFKPLEEIYELQVKIFKGDIGQLKQRLMALNGLVQEVGRTVQSEKVANDKEIRELRNIFELKIAQLDSQLKAKLSTLMDQKNSLTQETEEVKAVLQEVEHQLQSSTKCNFVMKSAERRRMIDQLKKTPVTSYDTALESANSHSIAKNSAIAETNDTGPYSAQMLRTIGSRHPATIDWTRMDHSHSAQRRSVSQECLSVSDNEDIEGYVPAPSYSQSFSDALAEALDHRELQPSGINVGNDGVRGKKKKKKGKPTVLFATNMARAS